MDTSRPASPAPDVFDLQVCKLENMRPSDFRVDSPGGLRVAFSLACYSSASESSRCFGWQSPKVEFIWCGAPCLKRIRECLPEGAPWSHPNERHQWASELDRGLRSATVTPHGRRSGASRFFVLEQTSRSWQNCEIPRPGTKVELVSSAQKISTVSISLQWYEDPISWLLVCVSHSEWYAVTDWCLGPGWSLPRSPGMSKLTGKERKK